MPVIMITAFGDKQIQEEAKTLGAAAVMDKPFDVEHLVDAAKRSRLTESSIVATLLAKPVS